MTSHESSLASWIPDRETLERNPVFVAELMVLRLVADIVDQMQRLGLRSKDLADRLGVSESAVSQLLRGDQNISLARIARIAVALEARVEGPRIFSKELGEQAPAVTIRGRRRVGSSG